MNEQSAKQLVAVLVAAFPTPEWSEATLELYASELARLGNERAARDAVAVVVRGSRWRPTIAELRDAYQSEARAYDERQAAQERERARERADTLRLPSPERAPIPPETLEWLRRRGINVAGLLRDVPDEDVA
jgi:hypothetical protein